MTMPETAADLASRHCQNLPAGTPTLSQEDTSRLLQLVRGWTVSDDGKSLRWTRRMTDFAAALQLVNTIGAIAEAEDHHPDIRIHGYRNVDLELSTHSIGGLSLNDFIMAAKVDQLVA